MIGIGLPNRPLLPDDLPRLAACRFSDYLDLYLDEGHWPGRWLDVARLGRLHVRVGVWGALDAAADAERLGQLVPIHPEVATWRIRNEPQIEADGATPAAWRNYLIELGRRVPATIRARLYVPAVAPGGPDWLAWLDASVSGAAEAGYAGLDAHAYGTPEEIAGVLSAHRERWAGPLLVTESNPGAGRAFDLAQWAADLPAVEAGARRYGASALILFIWEWASAPDLPTPVNVRGSPVETWLAGRSRPMRVGEGFRKAETLVGPWREDEIYHWPGTPDEVSLAVGERGFAVWCRATNETIAYVRNGQQLWADGGNVGDGRLRRVR